MNREDAAQAFMYHHSRAALATVDETGHPLATAVNVLPDSRGRLILLLSDLAAHTKNIRHHPSVSLMWVEQPHSDWQAATRLTVCGSLDAVPEEEGERYLQVFPHTRDYLALDFRFYALDIETAHWIPGFGKAVWLPGASVAGAWGWDLPREQSMVNHMNEDHADAIDHYLNLLGVAGKGAVMRAIDPWGAWLWHDEQLVRLPFANHAGDATQVRETLVALARTPVEEFFPGTP